jgi:transcriptional regulator of NAD metabolism
MYTEIGILIIIILGVSLFHNVYQDDSHDMTSSIGETNDEGFESQDSEYLRKMGHIDLRNERQKLLDELSRIDVATHEYSHSEDRSKVRVGIERMIAEIDRALESEGRFLSTKTVEAILSSGRKSLV